VEPNFGPSLLLGGEYSAIDLLPYFPKDESMEKLPDMVENGILEGGEPPVSNSVDNSFPIMVRCVHHKGSLVPNEGTKGAVRTTQCTFLPILFAIIIPFITCI
jgi:hypothetical protein